MPARAEEMDQGLAAALLWAESLGVDVESLWGGNEDGFFVEDGDVFPDGEAFPDGEDGFPQEESLYDNPASAIDEDPTAAILYDSALALDWEDTVPVSCEDFTLSVPREVYEQCSITAEERVITFIHKDSEGYGGFLGSVGLYPGLSSFVHYSEFERGGQVEFPEGTRYDIVAFYPVDVSYDYYGDHQAYDQVEEAFSLIWKTLTPRRGGKIIPLEKVDTTGIYAPCLGGLIKALEGQQDAQRLKEAGYSPRYARLYDGNLDRDSDRDDGNPDRNPLKAIGFAFTDRNRDGYAELVVGPMETEQVWDMWVWAGGKAAHVYSDPGKDNLSLRDGEGKWILLLNEKNREDGYQELTLYEVYPDQAETTLQLRLVYDPTKRKPYQIDYGYGDLEPTDEAGWLAIQAVWSRGFDPGYQPLSDWKGYEE